MALRCFENDDAGYEAWLAAHPSGWVVNAQRRPSAAYLKLHEAQHLALGRPDLVDEVELILGTVAHPDHRLDDPIPWREDFYRQHLDERRWLRVVVDFNDHPAWVVTALVQNNPPRGYKS